MIFILFFRKIILIVLKLRLGKDSRVEIAVVNTAEILAYNVSVLVKYDRDDGHILEKHLLCLVEKLCLYLCIGSGERLLDLCIVCVILVARAVSHNLVEMLDVSVVGIHINRGSCEILCEAAEKAGAPANMFQCLTTLSMSGTHELMTNAGVNMILATGGPEMVKAAYSSGVPALGVGAGNVPAFIDHTADVKLAVKRIFASKTFDNGVICASEQSIVAENCIKDQVIEAVKAEKGYIMNDEEYAKLCKIFTRRPGSVNPAIVGRPATKIAAMAGLDVPADTRVLCYCEKGVGDEYPFSIEKLSPCLALYFEEDWQACCERCIQLLEFIGIGHSLAMHTNDENVIREFALKKPVSRILVNTSSAQGGVGATTNLMPSLTLGCGAVGGSATSDNVSPLNLINLRRVAYGVKEAWDLVEAPAEKEELDAEAIAKMVIAALKEL